MIKLAIIGSRTFNNKIFFYEKLSEFIEKYGQPNEIISGGAKGADSLAEEYAKENNIPTTIFYPDWKKYGKSAGPLRNCEIVNNCTHILAFPSKDGRGTQDSIRKGNLNNKIVIVHYID